MSREQAEGDPNGAAEDGLEAALGRARRGDLGPIPTAGEATAPPEALAGRTGDLAVMAEEAWIALIAGDDLQLRQALARRVVEMAAEVAGPAPTVLECLLARRVVVAWLMANHADALYAQRSQGWSIRQSTFALDRMDRSSRRLNVAVGALAALRRLLPEGGRAVAVAMKPAAGRSASSMSTSGSEPAGTPASKSAGAAPAGDDPGSGAGQTIRFERTGENKKAGRKSGRGK